MSATIYIVEDDDAVRDSLSDLISLHGMRVITYPCAEVFLADFTPPTGLACILSDVCMPGMSGLELQQVLKRRHLHIPIIMMTGYANVGMAVEAMKLGAVDFIEKPFDSKYLFTQIHQSLRVYEKVRHREKQRESVTKKLARLTRRERQVMELLADGCQNRVIAEKLDISPRTVEIHRARVMEKLEASSVSDITRIALNAAEMREAGPD